MTTSNIPPVLQPVPKSSAGFYVLGGVLILLGLGVVGVIGVFHLGSEATVLRQTVMNSVPGQWDKKIALRAGWLMTGLVRGGSQFFHMPPEPRAALDAVRGVEVGVYNLRDEPGRLDRGPILEHADKEMAARGWVRVVGVIQENDLVAVYVPRKGISSRHMKCCVAVLNGRDLVVVSARGNLEPLMGIVEKHLAHNSKDHLLAWR